MCFSPSDFTLLKLKDPLLMSRNTKSTMHTSSSFGIIDPRPRLLTTFGTSFSFSNSTASVLFFSSWILRLMFSCYKKKKKCIVFIKFSRFTSVQKVSICFENLLNYYNYFILENYKTTIICSIPIIILTIQLFT